MRDMLRCGDTNLFTLFHTSATIVAAHLPSCTTWIGTQGFTRGGSQLSEDLQVEKIWKIFWQRIIEITLLPWFSLPAGISEQQIPMPWTIIHSYLNSLGFQLQAKSGKKLAESFKMKQKNCIFTAFSTIMENFRSSNLWFFNCFFNVYLYLIILNLQNK